MNAGVRNSLRNSMATCTWLASRTYLVWRSAIHEEIVSAASEATTASTSAAKETAFIGHSSVRWWSNAQPHRTLRRQTADAAQQLRLRLVEVGQLQRPPG